MARPNRRDYKSWSVDGPSSKGSDRTQAPTAGASSPGVSVLGSGRARAELKYQHNRVPDARKGWRQRQILQMQDNGCTPWWWTSAAKRSCSCRRPAPATGSRVPWCTGCSKPGREVSVRGPECFDDASAPTPRAGLASHGDPRKGRNIQFSIRPFSVAVPESNLAGSWRAFPSRTAAPAARRNGCCGQGFRSMGIDDRQAPEQATRPHLPCLSRSRRQSGADRSRTRGFRNPWRLADAPAAAADPKAAPEARESRHLQKSKTFFL